MEINETSSTPSSALNFTTTESDEILVTSISPSTASWTGVSTPPATLNFTTTAAPLDSNNGTDSSETRSISIQPRMQPRMARAFPFPTPETPLFSVNLTDDSSNEPSLVTIVGVGPWARSLPLPEPNTESLSPDQEDALKHTLLSPVVYSYMPMTSWVFSDLEEAEDDEYDTDDESVEVIPEDLILTTHSAPLKPLLLLNPSEDLVEDAITETPIHKTTKKGKIVKKNQKKKRKTTKKRKAKTTKNPL